MSEKDSIKLDIIKNFGKPCAVVDLNILEKNISSVQKICDNAGL